MQAKDKEKQQARQQIDQARQMKIDKKKKIETSKPVEFELVDIEAELRQIQAIMKCLKVSCILID